MDNVVFTQLSISEIRQLFRQELETYFASQKADSSQSQEGEQLLTIKQAGELLSLSVPTIYGLVSKAEIPVSKRGKRLYFSKQELTDWIKAGRKKTNSEIEETAQKFVNHKRR